MPGCNGYRSRTRDLFSRSYRNHGHIPISSYLRNYKIRDFVDIKVNGAIHKGMPHKVYQGRTGLVWNISKSAIGVEINKRVGGRVIKKRIHVRIEHVKPSRCREDFLKRVKEKAKCHGGKKLTRRINKKPARSFILTHFKMETVTPIPYDIVNEGLMT